MPNAWRNRLIGSTRHSGRVSRESTMPGPRSGCLIGRARHGRGMPGKYFVPRARLERLIDKRRVPHLCQVSDSGGYGGAASPTGSDTGEQQGHGLEGATFRELDAHLEVDHPGRPHGKAIGDDESLVLREDQGVIARVVGEQIDRGQARPNGG